MESEGLGKYIARVDKVCGTENDYVVLLKHAKRDSALKDILGKVRVVEDYAGAMKKVEYKNVRFIVFPSGRIVFKNVKPDDVLSILKELLEGR